MKKLMVMLGAVAVAASLSAASVTWKVTNVAAQGTATTEGYKTYFLMSSDSSTAASTTLSIADATTMAKNKNASGLAGASMVAAKGLTDEGGVSSAKLSTYASTWVSPESGKFYAVPPAISHRNTRCVALADKDFLVVDRSIAGFSWACKAGFSRRFRLLSMTRKRCPGGRA